MSGERRSTREGRLWSAALVAGAALASCGTSISTYDVPQATGDGWSTASLADVGLHPDPFVDLVEFVEDDTARALHGIVVVKDDKLVFEQYFDGYRFDYDDPQFRGERVDYGIETRHNLMSVTKAVTGALVGQAIDDGLIAGVDEPVVGHFPEYHRLADGPKDEITVEHLLTMTSGLEWNEWEVPLTDVGNNDLIQLFVVDDPIEYILAKPAVHRPGTYWNYSGGDVNLLGEFFEQATGVSIDEYSETRLFGPLGITDYQWQYINPDIVYTSGELELRPRDLAKFGSLYLNGGVWKGTQVISNAWVDTSIREHVSIPGRAADGDGYGYQWFTRTYESNGARVAAALRTGWGGQAVIIFPDHDTLVVLTGGDYLLQRQLSDLITGYLVPAIVESAGENE